MSKMSRLILQKQLEQLSKDDTTGFNVGLVDENDIYKWNVVFQGPEGTDYEGGLFRATLTFPENFPQMPPKMVFLTEMWHPNIYKNGEVCISILHDPGTDPQNEMETADLRWRPIYGVEQILVSVISMLNDPNINSPANVDASVEFKDHPEEYRKKVRKLTMKSMDCYM